MATVRPQRMTDFEALMWTLEDDPRLSSNVANLTLFDRPPDLERLRRRLDHAAAAVPRLRQKVVEGPWPVATPSWVEDEHFDIDHQVRLLHCPRRSQRALLNLCMELFEEPFDRSRPLWDFVVIDGLRDGKAAMLQRLHHTVTDGEGGLRLSLQFVDTRRNADDPRRRSSTVGDQRTASPPAGGVGGPVGELARTTAGAVRWTVGEAVGRTLHPGRTVRDVRHALDAAGSALRQAGLTERRRSPLWTERSHRPRLDLIEVELAPVREAARRFGVTVNDVFVAALAGAAGAYHRREGVDVHELRMGMPVSTRGGDDSASNRFAPSQVLVPTGEMAPSDRLALIHEALATTKQEPAIGVVETLAAAMNLLPSPLVVQLGVRTAQTVDFVASNLRGAPFDLYIAGALMEGNYPLGPLATTAFNATVMSYRGRMDIGLLSDTGAIEHPRRLANLIESEFEAISRLGLRKRRSVG